MKPARIVRLLQGQCFVYCAEAWQRAAARTALRIPITSPPVTVATFKPTWMAGKRLLYFKLHGYPDRPDWYGMDRDGIKMSALSPDLIRQADLTGAIVVAAVCYGAGGEMMKAFFDAGVAAFFGSFKEVRGREDRPREVDLLCKYLLSTLSRGQQNLSQALARARELYYQKYHPLSDDNTWTLATFTVVLPEQKHGNV